MIKSVTQSNPFIIVYVYKFNTGPKIFDFIHLWFAGFHNSEYLGFKKSDTNIYIYVCLSIYISYTCS